MYSAPERKRRAKEKPSLKILLDEAQAVEFSGEIVLADDLSLIKIPRVMENGLPSN